MQSFLSQLFLGIAGAAIVVALYWTWRSVRLLVMPVRAVLPPAVTSARRGALLEEKEVLLRTLRELEMDHEVGKLSDRDFERLNERCRARAREVLRLLDAEIAPYRERARAILADAAGDGRTP